MGALVHAVTHTPLARTHPHTQSRPHPGPMRKDKAVGGQGAARGVGTDMGVPPDLTNARISLVFLYWSTDSLPPLGRATTPFP